MRILTSLSAVDAGGIAIPSDIRPERLPEIGAFLKNAYYMEQTGGHELDEFDTEDYTASGKFIFGLTNPDTILNVIERWNDIFVENLRLACRRVFHPAEKTTGHTNINFDAYAIHRLHIAARHADNKMTSSAPQGVYLENPLGFPYFKTLLSKDDMTQIKANPERYVLVSIELPEI